jgi:dCTP deaminase
MGSKMVFAKRGYWSGETLQKRLPTLITPPGAFDPNRIDCASYRLSIGTEIYVSPTVDATDPQSVTVQVLESGAAFTIPAGQFALLMTHEIVEVPDDAIAFISIRAKTKFKGLVNVSGFHVDPGYMGQLTFAVFNAAPREIHLRQGQDIFVLWYAYLDQKTKSIKREHARLGLNIELVQGISGELESFASLGHKLKDVKTALDKTERVLSERIHSVEREQTYYRLVAALVLAVLIAVVGNWIKGEIDQRSRITPDKSMQLR